MPAKALTAGASQSWSAPSAQLLLDFLERYAGTVRARAPRVPGGHPSVAKNDFESRRQAAVLPKRFIGGLHRGKLAPSGKTFGSPCRCIVRSGGLEVRGNPAQVKIGQR